jgi:hypothetical protein
MSIVLARIGGVLSRHFVAIFFFDKRSLSSGLRDTNSTFGLVLAGGRVLVRNELVLAANSHVSFIITEGLKMGIVLTRIRRLLAGDLVAILLFDDRSLSSRLGDTNSTFRFILAGGRVRVGHKLVLSSNSHRILTCAEVSSTERLDVTIVLARIGGVLSGHLVA